MTYSDQISAYVDSELSIEQEQEFLISLAANEGLRKTFRSDLVLKSVIHRDELMTAPPREMRSAVFAAIGIGLGATALSASKAEATTTASAGSASQISVLKSLVMSKFGAALTVGSMLVGGIGGYAVHDGLSHSDAASMKPATTIQQSAAPTQEVTMPSAPAQVVATQNAPEHKIAKSHATKSAVRTDSKSTPMDVTGAPGTIEIDQTPAK